MSRRPIVQIAPIREEWKRRMGETEFRQLSAMDQGKQLGISDQTIYRWIQDLEPEQWEKWLEKDNQELAPKILKVDDTLYKQSLTGDVAAIKLWKESKQGWSPKQNLEISRGADKELTPEQMVQALKDAMGLLSPEQRAEVVEAAQQPVLEVKSDPVEGGAPDA